MVMRGSGGGGLFSKAKLSEVCSNKFKVEVVKAVRGLGRNNANAQRSLT